MQTISDLTARERALQVAVRRVRCPIAKARLAEDLAQVRRNIKARYLALVKRS